MSEWLYAATGNYKVTVFKITKQSYENRNEYTVYYSLSNGILSANSQATLYQWPDDQWSGNEVHLGEWNTFSPNEARRFAEYLGLTKPQVDEAL